MKTFTLITTALFLSVSIHSVAKAAPISDLPIAIVKFGDLDMSRPAGKEKLYRRLSRAAEAVCSPLEGPSGSRALVTPQYKACIDRVLSDAIAQFNRRDFTDYVATRTHKPLRVATSPAS